MKSANAKTIEVIPGTNERLIPFEAQEVSWERARQLWSEAKDRARLSGEALVQLGAVLGKLRTQYFSSGGRPKKNSNRGVGVIEKGLGDLDRPASNKGWEATVLAETGIPAHTARRLIDDAKYVLLARSVASGEAVTYTNTAKQKVIIQPTPALVEEAQKVLPDIELGLVKPSTAWRGIMGEGIRRDRQGGVKDRAPVDHAKVMLGAIKSLITGFRFIADLDEKDQAAVLHAWAALANAAPDHLASFFARKAAKK